MVLMMGNTKKQNNRVLQTFAEAEETEGTSLVIGLVVLEHGELCIQRGPCLYRVIGIRSGIVDIGESVRFCVVKDEMGRAWALIEWPLTNLLSEVA